MTMNNTSDAQLEANQAKPVGTPRPPVAESAPEERAEGWHRVFWIVVCVLCAVWIFIPNIPIPFFLDEGLAMLILLTGLAKLGIRIPVLDWFFKRKMGGRSGLPTRRPPA